MFRPAAHSCTCSPTTLPTSSTLIYMSCSLARRALTSPMSATSREDHVNRGAPHRTDKSGRRTLRDRDAWRTCRPHAVLRRYSPLLRRQRIQHTTARMSSSAREPAPGPRHMRVCAVPHPLHHRASSRDIGTFGLGRQLTPTLSLSIVQVPIVSRTFCPSAGTCTTHRVCPLYHSVAVLSRLHILVGRMAISS